MVGRNSRYKRIQEDYSEDTDDSTRKRPRVVKKAEPTETAEVEESPDFKDAMNALEKQKENSLLLVSTELRMRLESANALAAFEEKRIQQFFTDQVAALKKQLAEESQIKTRSRIAEEAKQGRMMLHSADAANSAGNPLSKKDQCVFSVPLPEEEIVNDILFMANDTMQLYAREKKSPLPIVSPLSHNRLLLNNRVVTPDTPCTLYSNGNKVVDCVFVSTMVKEKENLEKKKEPEFVVKVSATRKRRFPIDSLRTGEMVLVCRDSGKSFQRTVRNDEGVDENSENSDYE